MRTTFSAWPEPARHETVAGILSPEGLCLLWSLALPTKTPNSGVTWCNNTNAFTKKLLKGLSPEGWLPLALWKIVKSIARAQQIK